MPKPGQERRAVPTVAGAVKHIVCIGAALRPCEIREHAQAAVKSALVIDLERIVEAIRSETAVCETVLKIRIRREIELVESGRKDLAGGIWTGCRRPR